MKGGRCGRCRSAFLLSFDKDYALLYCPSCNTTTALPIRTEGISELHRLQELCRPAMDLARIRAIAELYKTPAKGGLSSLGNQGETNDTSNEL